MLTIIIDGETVIANSKNLKKELGLIHVFAIATGAMVSSGIFLLPGLAFAKTGPSVVVSYFIAGMLALTGLISVAELVTAMPKAGGDYYYVSRGMGPAVGSIAGTLAWFALSLKTAFALVGISAFTDLFFDIPFQVTGLSLCLIFVILNLFGTRHAGGFQVVFVLALLAIMVFFIVSGLPKVSIDNFKPFSFNGTTGIIFTAGFVFTSYGGLLKISGIAEEVRDPGRNIPLGMILSLFVTIVAYSLMVFITVGTVDSNQLSSSLTPIIDSAETFLGKPGVWAIGIAAILAFISTANAGIMAASRYLFAMGRDGLAPEFLKKTNRKFETPHWAIVITGLFISAALFAKLDILIEATSLVMISGYILSCLCVIIMRESDIQNYHPIFKTPYYPLPQIAGILGFSYIILEMGHEAYLIILSLLAFSFMIYWFYGRKKITQEYALMHLIQKITSKKIVSGTLESELKQVIRERDSIVKDNFDKMVSVCPVIDLEKSINADELFSITSEALAERLGIDQDKLLKLFREREEQCSTAIIPGIAIPHIVLEESNTFDIVVVRAKQGVTFPCSDNNEPVKIIFAIAGSIEKRTFHLQTLANIAQIASDGKIFDNWLDAKGEQGIRDLILLSKRLRS